MSLPRQNNTHRYQLTLSVPEEQVPELTRGLQVTHVVLEAARRDHVPVRFEGPTGDLLVVALRTVDHDLEAVKPLWVQRVPLFRPSTRRKDEDDGGSEDT